VIFFDLKPMKSTPFTLVLLAALLLQLLGAPSCPAADGPGRRKNASAGASKKYWRPVSRRVVTSERFQLLSRTHRTIAILPVEVHIVQDAAGPFNRQLRHRARVEASNLYPVLFAFLQRQNSGRTSPLKLQDITLTQRLLASHHLDGAAFKQVPPARLATLLGVDAVLFCSIHRQERLVAEANLRHNLKRISGWAGPSAGTASAHLYDGKTNEKLWQFEGLLTADLGRDMDQTIRSIGSLVAHELPYFNF
jgi:hypothetical protein